MRATRLVHAALGVALLVVASTPVAAQTKNIELISDLNLTLLYAAIPITILVEAILIYAVVKFRNNDDPDPTRENRRLEITWTVATAIVLLFVGFASYQVLAVEVVGNPIPGDEERVEPTVSEDLEGAAGPYESEDDAVEIELRAFRYGWEAIYEGTEVTTNNEIRIPTDRPVYIHVISEDWLHMLSAPDLGLKQSAFPGEYNTIKTVANEEGNHQFYCTEYCGVGHSQMNGEFIVMGGEEYDQWLADQQEAAESGGQGSGNATNGTEATPTPTPTPAA
ncbi:cytochrome c oxidase subunit II [Natronomonas marina]|jgi:cytochrome c oxidase subunit 2|uniref:cytochrome c oxidase subunit II n=1 Tax=Natronomonas marina TaxID=2961939 RepID=UPI0020CA04AE|nr:cytochrome c oxidase subunit II [Natronomonas marina]